MKIAFVGKGGAGKSTISSLFIEYAQQNNQKVLAIDADINVHLAELLGVPIHQDKALSLDNNTHSIRSFLKGDNVRIASASHFVKTTPPGKGSRFLQWNNDNPILKNYAIPFGTGNYFMYVGTYTEDGIGVSCYHTNLSVLENLLSHAILNKNEWIICDMVAGTDAFSNTLHAQFDAIFLVVEPTPEGTKVFEQYTELAKAAGVYSCLQVIGNKVEGEDDIAYLRKVVGDKLVTHVPFNKNLRKARQNNELPKLSDMADDSVFKNILDKAVALQRDPKQGLALLHELHSAYVKQDYIVNAFGDITDQIDPHFTYEQTNFTSHA